METMNSPHRKRKVTFNIPGHAHFLTYSCFQRLPLLSRDRSRGWVVEVVQEARQKFDFDLWAYVIMPEHVHLLIRPRQEQYQMERILAALKRPVSVRAKAYLVSTQNTAWLGRLTVREGQQEVFRFWQTGGGYDHNLWNDRPIVEVIDYIHANPVRRGLVKQPTDWIWSSARFWVGDLSGPLLMDSLDVDSHG
jgi:putative transposase